MAGLCECGCGQQTKISPYNDAPRGYVRGVPMRFVRGHANRGRHLKAVRYTVEDRGFDTPCWVWALAMQPNGYGHFASRLDGYFGTAHRWYWEQENGPLPGGAHLDHLCRVRACVNPAHLQPVTCAENARRGENAKLTYDDIEEIKRLRGEGLLQREVAERFGVVRQTISDIERGTTWTAPGGVLVGV